MRKLLPALIVFFALINFSCSSIYETLVNLSRLQFKLGDVNNFALNGISLSNKSKLSDFSALDIVKISTAAARGALPVSFVLNVQAKNPNDGTGGYKKSAATIKSFPFRLLIDDKETISGNIGSPVGVPGTGEITIIPLQINLDLVKFFEDKGYESLINLALSLGGKSGSSSKLELLARPTVTSSFGDISYPNELSIVNLSFTK